MKEAELDHINAALRAAEYQDAKPKFVHELHLRTALPLSDLAESIAHLIWAGILQKDSLNVLDPHRFPPMIRIIDDVLSHHLKGCNSIDQSHWDTWAHTGGGAPTRRQRPLVCDQHAKRIEQEAGPELSRLLDELEQKIGDYLSQQVSPFESESSSLLKSPIHQTVQGVVKAYLIKNLASACCDECQEMRGQPL